MLNSRLVANEKESVPLEIQYDDFIVIGQDSSVQRRVRYVTRAHARAKFLQYWFHN